MALLIEKFEAATAQKHIHELADLLRNVVEAGDGASVSFLSPLSSKDAENFWRNVVQAIAEKARILLVAWDESRLVGTVQLGLVTIPNQPHRADVMKLLVHSQARRRGIARLLMQRLEQEAKIAGR